MRSGTIPVARTVFPFLFGWLALAAAAQAQYPSRMVRAIVPYTPGSSADLIARNLGPRLSEGWKVPFLVDNRAGASGIIGVQAVVAAPGDGYTVLIMADNFASAASVRPNSYDPVNDLDPVILLARGDYALMASASLPARSVAELVDMARASPGRIYYASPGSGLPAHLMMEVFKSAMGIDLVHVPYKNNAAAVTDLAGGQVSLMFASVGVALPLAEGGRIRILGRGREARRAHARNPELHRVGREGLQRRHMVRDARAERDAARDPRETPRRHRGAPEGAGGGRAHVQAGNDARGRKAGGAARSHPVGLRSLEQDRARSQHQGGLIMQKATRKLTPDFEDSFEDHCWKDIMPPDVIELYSNYRREVGVGPSPALIAIDLYELVYQGGAKPVTQVMKTYPNSCGEYAWAAIAPTKRLFAAARAAGLPVFYSTGDTRPQSQPKSVRATRRQGVHVDRELYAIRPEFKPQPQDVVITKVRASAFYGTPLAAHLTQLGVKSVIVCGESTSGCVRASAVDAYSHGFHVTLVEECCFDRSPISHKVNLFDMHHKYADVLHVDEVIAHLEGMRAGAR